MIPEALQRMADALVDYTAQKLLTELAVYGCVAIKDGRIIPYEELIDVDNPATPCDASPVPDEHTLKRRPSE